MRHSWTNRRLRARRKPIKDAPNGARETLPISRSGCTEPTTIDKAVGALADCVLVPPEQERHRVLLLTGARLHAQFAQRIDTCLLAMLDPGGIVVSWYGESFPTASADQGVLDHHVSQFYLAADLAMGVPGRSLRSAADCGIDTQEGWRRRPSGAIFWCTTVVEAIVCVDGQLLGFSHVMRPARGPWEILPIAVRRPQHRRIRTQVQLPAFGGMTCPNMVML